MAIERGHRVRATTAGGDQVVMVALGAPHQGADFQVVWVATEAEWERAQRDGDEPDGLPWPVTAIEEAAPA
ncbi:MAG TPA: hypothetical protein VJ851_06050 [Jatrophihabitans sp.]|nr:hypothetical protein [Jatrophihabitans sp.]